MPRFTAGRAPFTLPRLALITEKIPWRLQYRHPNWELLRKTILKRDKYICRACKKGDRTLTVHHKKYYGNYIWDVEPKDLVTLCEQCHKREHRRLKAAQRQVKREKKRGRK